MTTLPPTPPPPPSTQLFDPIAKKKSIEWESTICVEIKKQLFDSVFENALTTTTSEISSDVILFFTNGSRLSSRTVERKVFTEKKFVLGFLNGRFYPIRRTKATEERTVIDPTLSVEKALLRIIVSPRETYEGGLKMRVAYCKEEIDDGVRYTFTCEAEYPHTSTYNDILSYERCLMTKFSNHFGSTQVEFDKLTLGEMFSCVVPKIHMWNCFNPQDDYLWAYKWNGIKAKFMSVNGHAYIWPDASEIYTKRYQGDLTFIGQMCVQVELMDDAIVVVEVIAAAFKSKIYTTEPLTNVAILNHLSAVLGESTITVGNKRLIVQKFYNTILPKTFPVDSDYDGYIIVQQDLTIKWKPPTVDVKCVGPYEYMVGSSNQNVVIKLSERDTEDRENVAGVVGCIYEMSSDFRILRQRVDRITCSTGKEYKTFLESLQLIDTVKCKNENT